MKMLPNAASILSSFPIIILKHLRSVLGEAVVCICRCARVHMMRFTKIRVEKAAPLPA